MDGFYGSLEKWLLFGVAGACLFVRYPLPVPVRAFYKSFSRTSLSFCFKRALNVSTTFWYSGFLARLVN